MSKRKQTQLECNYAFKELNEDFMVMIENHQDHMTPLQFAFNLMYLTTWVLVSLKQDTKAQHVMNLAYDAISIAYNDMQKRGANDKSASNQPVNEELGQNESGNT